MLQEEVGNHDGISSGQKDDKEWIPAFAGMTDQGVTYVIVAAHVVTSSFPAILPRRRAWGVIMPSAYHGHAKDEVIEWMTRNV
jgi:hypothetical protein